MPPVTKFAPDVNPLTSGIIVDCDGAYPSEAGGIRAIPALATFTDALAAECTGCFSYQDLSVNFRTFAGTQTKLYQLNNTSWIDVSQAGDYNSAYRWRFTAWGNYCIATNGVDPIQVQATILTDFADLAGTPPKARYITTAQNFLILGNVNDGTPRPNRVYWSAQGNHTDWTPAISTQCGYVDLDDSPGEITGLAKLGDYFVVFKEKSIYLGTYVGPPYVWAFRRISAFGGCQSQEAVVELEHGIFYPGLDDFYVFDGNVPRRIGQDVRYWFFNRVDRNYASKMMGGYDGIRRLIFWFFPTTVNGTGKCVDCLIFDYQQGRWGRQQLSIEAMMIHFNPVITYDTINSFFATYDDINVIYDSPWWSASSFGLAVVDTSHKLARFSGTPGTTTVITGDIGSLQSNSKITRIWPYFDISPTTCTITPRTKTKLGDTATERTAATLGTQGKADSIANGKFISLKMVMTGDYDLVGFDTDIISVSKN